MEQTYRHGEHRRLTNVNSVTTNVNPVTLTVNLVKTEIPKKVGNR